MAWNSTPGYARTNIFATSRYATVANVLTFSRIALSVALLTQTPLSPAFLALLAAAGITDMIDGAIARATGSETEFGEKLDSIADVVLAAICLATILPAVSLPLWLLIWIAVIAVEKIANLAGGLLMYRRLIAPHTTANKIAGVLVFLVPFVIPIFGAVIPAIPACIAATFAVIQEGHYIRLGLDWG